MYQLSVTCIFYTWHQSGSFWTGKQLITLVVFFFTFLFACGPKVVQLRIDTSLRTLQSDWWKLSSLKTVQWEAKELRLVSNLIFIILGPEL